MIFFPTALYSMSFVRVPRVAVIVRRQGVCGREGGYKLYIFKVVTACCLYRYFLSFMWIYLLNHAVTFDLCTVTFLRGQNIVCMVLLFLVLHSLLKDIRGERASCEC